MELRLLPPDLLQQKECTEVLNDYITSFRYASQLNSKELILRGFELNYNHFRDLVTYERESGDVLERFNESLNMVRVNLATGSKKSL